MEEGVDTYEMLAALLVQTARLYDLLSLIVADNPHFKELVEAHQRGEVFSPPPYLNNETWNDE